TNSAVHNRAPPITPENRTRDCNSTVAASAASLTPAVGLSALSPKFGIGFGRRRYLRALEETRVGGLVEHFAQHGQENPRGIDHLLCHCSSMASLVGTKGDSLTWASRFPLRTPIQTLADSITTRLTITTNRDVTAASSRLLKIRR